MMKKQCHIPLEVQLGYADSTIERYGKQIRELTAKCRFLERETYRLACENERLTVENKGLQGRLGEVIPELIAAQREIKKLKKDGSKSNRSICRSGSAAAGQAERRDRR